MRPVMDGRATRRAAFVAAVCAATRAAHADVLILSSDYATTPAYVNDVKAKIVNTGQFAAGEVDIHTASALPSLATLKTYDAVLVFGEARFSSATVLGDLLADYSDSGRTVVEAAFGGGRGGNSTPGGRWQSGGYAPFVNLPDKTSPGFGTGRLRLGTVYAPASPLLSGVVSFGGGSGSYHNVVGFAPTGVTKVADWSNGDPLVARRTDKPGTIVGLNFYPPSASVRHDYWSTATQGGLLMANALAQTAPEPGSAALVLLSMLPLTGRPRWIRQRRTRKLSAA